MSLADSESAISAVSQLLKDQVSNLSGIPADIGFPGALSVSGPKVLMYLYEVSFDPHLKNFAPDEGQPVPLWLVLKYLVTAFDRSGNADTIEAQLYLGKALRALKELSFLPLDHWQPGGNLLEALQSNPEDLKITFDEINPDLLSKIMQGYKEQYRFAMGFQVRPVMIATGEAPRSSLLVGVAYSGQNPGVIDPETDRSVSASAQPAFPAPRIDRVSLSGKENQNDDLVPLRISVGSSITITGAKLDLLGLALFIGPIRVTQFSAQQSTQLTADLQPLHLDGNSLSAGYYPLYVAQEQANAQETRSNYRTVQVVPEITSATPAANSHAGMSWGTISLQGTLLGSKSDEVSAALYFNGKVVAYFNDLVSDDATQTSLTITIPQDRAVPSGVKYRLLFRVNGAQATQSPEVPF